MLLMFKVTCQFPIPKVFFQFSGHELKVLRYGCIIVDANLKVLLIGWGVSGWQFGLQLKAFVVGNISSLVSHTAKSDKLSLLLVDYEIAG